MRWSVDNRRSAGGRPGRLTAALCAVAVCLAAAGPASASEGEGIQTHVFEPVLSLTGNCETSTEDEVPDPGCPSGPQPPAGRFDVPLSEAVDRYGDIYVASSHSIGTLEWVSVIDVFNPKGEFITEIEEAGLLSSIAVDAEGNVYGLNNFPSDVLRFDPELYEPERGVIRYGSAATVVLASGSGAPGGNSSVAVDTATGHLYVTFPTGRVVHEYGSAAEGNPLLDSTIGEGSLGYDVFVAVDAATGDVYVSSSEGSESAVIREFEGAGTAHKEVRTFSNTCVENGRFGSGTLPVAVDESDGHVFIDDRESSTSKRAVYEFTETGECIGSIEHKFIDGIGTEIAIDDGAHSPNGELDALGKVLYVPSGYKVAQSHVFAFVPKEVSRPPVVESVGFGGVTEGDARLSGVVNPEGAATHVVFEVVSEAAFEAEGFAGAVVAGESGVASGKHGVGVSATAEGLAAGTAYRFRVRAQSECETVAVEECAGEREGRFVTFGAAPVFGGCVNEGLRVGASSLLPDCRAFELVSPPETNGHTLFDPGHTNGDVFGESPVSVAGDSAAFLTQGGAIPGFPGTGAFNGDPYLASRGGSGWVTEAVGLAGWQSNAPDPGSFSPDLGWSLVTARLEGSLVVEGKESVYMRSPDGSFALVGRGSLGVEPEARAVLLGPDASHVIFQSGAVESPTRQLEPAAPPTGTGAIYDRTPDGVTHVVSLLPGDVTPAAGEAAAYLGGSAEGNAVAFQIGKSETSPLYVRVEDERTLQVAGAGATLAGVSRDGRYVFYLAGGDLYRYDTGSEASVRITTSGDVTVVNVPESGEAAYFVSESAIAGARANPRGAEPQAGDENLYLWREGAIGFVGAVTARDVEGEFTGNIQRDGLGLWVEAERERQFGADPSRSTAGGQVLLFESRADLTGYESGGHAEVYRFDAAEDSLSCLSCDPTGAVAETGARLESVNSGGSQVPTTERALVANLSANGRRAFFESSEPLVAADSDGVQDVYEWEADGDGSCSTAGGCVYLISSGQSAQPSYLYGVSESGDDVFIYTSDRLSWEDPSETASIYDARVGGGFTQPGGAAECLGEACQPLASVPSFLAPGTASLQGPPGNVRKSRRCGRHRVLRHGHCVKPGKGSARKRRLRRALRRCAHRHRHSREARRRCERRVRRRLRVRAGRRHAGHHHGHRRGRGK